MVIGALPPAGTAALQQEPRIEPNALEVGWGALCGIRRRGGALAGVGGPAGAQPHARCAPRAELLTPFGASVGTDELQ